ncbi:MAG TPA: hypothetical protein IAC64_05555 [Candidatus Caccomorpha excrementavium]|nr:hypothetical protein [Candidatus Caccomorpha excrementavium]
MKIWKIRHMGGIRGTIAGLLLLLMTGMSGCALGSSEESGTQTPQEQTQNQTQDSPDRTDSDEMPVTEGTAHSDANSQEPESPAAESAGNTAASDGSEEIEEGEQFEEFGVIFETTHDIVYCTADLVNLRSAPSYDGDVLRQAEKGEEFVRTGKGEGEWDRIEDGSGNLYYAASRYLSRYNPLEAEGFTWDLNDLQTVSTARQLYDYEEMVSDLKELEEAYPEHLSVSSLGTTVDGRDIFLAVLGNPDASGAIIVQAAIHAREYMTVLLTMKQLEYYLYYYDTGYYNGIPYSEIFEHTAVYVIPMLNPDGVTISQKGLEGIRLEAVREEILSWYERDSRNGVTSYSPSDYLKYFKANANGVDLNRNFDMGWEEFAGSAEPGAEKYKGEAPGSEKESAALIELTDLVLPQAVISYHATGSILYWDYGQTGEFREECESLTKLISGITGYQMIYKENDGGVDAAGYSDWAAGVRGIPAVTIEIGTGRAPLSIEEFPAVWDRNREVIAAVAARYMEE